MTFNKMYLVIILWVIFVFFFVLFLYFQIFYNKHFPFYKQIESKQTDFLSSLPAEAGQGRGTGLWDRTTMPGSSERELPRRR